MGFGYLLIGYLVTFLLYLPVAGLGMGGLALLLGYGLMMYGLWELNHYERAFVFAKWLCPALMLTALYRILSDFNTMLALGLPFVTEAVTGAVDGVLFLLLMIYQLAMLYAIRAMAGTVGLAHLATRALRNSVFVAMYALLYLLVRVLPADVVAYLSPAVVLLNFACILLNLLLLLSCNKNICRAGDEDQPAKPSRFGFLNRMNETYERNRQRAIDNTTREAEEALRRRQAAREKKKKKK